MNLQKQVCGLLAERNYFIKNMTGWLSSHSVKLPDYTLSVKLILKKIIYPIREQIIFFIADMKVYPYNSIPYVYAKLKLGHMAH